MKSVNLVASVFYNGEYELGDFIGVDSGAKYLIDKNLPIKTVIGDFDSIDDISYQKLIDKDIELIKLSPVKNNTDLDIAIQYALKEDYDFINVYGALGNRVDHTLVNLNLLKKYPMIKLYDDTSIVFVLKKGKHIINKSNYQYYSFFAIKECEITLNDFKYPLDNYCLKMDDTLCISNELESNASIETSEDIIVVMSK
ncbi:thiamine pyrophosphokinase [Bacilli bacterium PM5-3]|nr:thiamine pyrophosphokinase [Bacilli bacterium PM5-3]